MTIINAIILGLIQGLSEFLPISSSGHLAIAGAIMKMDTEASNLLSFNILLHVATLAAVFIAFRSDISELIRAFFGMVADLFRGKGLRLAEFEYRRLIVLLIVATIPAVIAALLFGDLISTPKLWQIGLFLLITSALLFSTNRIKEGTTTLEKITYKQALCIGVFQGFGTLPGISRSGSTIVGGLFGKLSRQAAVRFSFLLSIPAILGALVLDIKNIASSGEQFLTVSSVVAGMITAAVSGYFAIRFLLKLVSNNKLSVFAYYCLFAGLFSIILNFII